MLPDAEAQKRWEHAELHALSMIAALETCPWLASQSCQQSGQDLARMWGRDVNRAERNVCHTGSYLMTVVSV